MIIPDIPPTTDPIVAFVPDVDVRSGGEGGSGDGGVEGGNGHSVLCHTYREL